MTTGPATPPPDRPNQLLVVWERADDTPDTDLLLSILRAMAPDLTVELRFLLFAGGPRLADFEALAPTVVVWDLERTSRSARTERMLFALRLRRPAYARRAKRLGLGPWRRGDAVYLHDVSGLQALRYLPADAPPSVVCRLADPAPLRHRLRRRDRTLVLRRVDRFLVVDAGWGRTRDGAQVPPERIHVVPPLFRPTEAVAPAARPGVRDGRAALGIGPDDVVVGVFLPAMGAHPEPLAVLAGMIRRRHVGPRLAVLAAVPERAVFAWLDHDLDCAGLADSVHVVRMAPDPLLGRSIGHAAPYIPLCDVVVLWEADAGVLPTAYEDGLRLGIPTACSRSSALARVAEAADPALVLDRLDPALLATRLASITSDPGRLRAARGAVLASVDAREGPQPSARVLLAELADAAGWRPPHAAGDR